MIYKCSKNVQINKHYNKFSYNIIHFLQSLYKKLLKEGSRGLQQIFL